MEDQGNDTKAARRFTRRKKLGFGLVAAALLFLVCEVGLRVVAGARGRTMSDHLYHATGVPGPFRPHPYLPIVLKPNFDDRWAGRTHVKTNSLGLRGPKIPKTKPAGVIRVACLGGSTTFGFYPYQNRDTYPAQLEQLLRPATSRSVQVINAGVPIYTTADSLINLALRVVDYSPDVVIIYHGCNDAWAMLRAGFKSDYSHYRKRFGPPELPWPRRLLCRSMLYVVLANRLSQFTGHRRPTLMEFVEQPGPDVAKLPPEALPTFRRNLISLIGLARAHGANVVLSTFIDFRDDRKLPMVRRIIQANEVIREVARTEAVTFVDNDRLFPRERDLHTDFCHFTNKGAALLAQNFADAIRQAGLLEKGQ